MMLWKGSPSGPQKGPAPPSPATDPSAPCEALEKFFQRAVQIQPVPYILMLGELCGANLTFLGERGFRVDKETDVRPGPDRAYSGALLWDALTLMPLAEAVRRIDLLYDALAPGGALLAFFDPLAAAATRPRTRYRILSENRLSQESVPGRRVVAHRYQNRDIVRIFERFEVGLLQMRKSGRRDALLFKGRSGSPRK